VCGEKPDRPSEFLCHAGATNLLQKCVLCHNAEKFKGKLRLDGYQQVMLGGKNGPVISPREPTKSEIYRRITLPPDSKESRR
jgi:hypothetical protein